jgi:hypothetical protein
MLFESGKSSGYYRFYEGNFCQALFDHFLIKRNPQYKFLIHFQTPKTQFY